MTDARLPDRWLTDRRLLRLPDDAFRLFVTSLMWSVANKTDGVLYDDDLPLIPGGSPGSHGQLARAGLWVREWDRWVITVFADSQTSSDELDALAARRLSDRKRKAAERLRKAGSRERSRDSHAESVRTGQARQGQAPRNVVPGLNGDNRHGDLRGAGAEGDAAGGEGQPATPPHSLREHDGPDSRGSDVQNFSNRGTARAQPADRNAREACPVCGMKQKLRTNGKLARHGPKFTPCRGSGMALTGTAP
jgi:hypothetical protein